MGSTVELSMFELDRGYDDTIITGILRKVDDSQGPLVIVSPWAIFDETHLSMGIMHAARSILSGRSRARDDSMEVIRCLAGAHQISAGMDSMKPEKGSSSILMIQLPGSWPNEDDASSLPDLEFIINDIGIPDIAPIGELHLGGPDSLAKLGIASKNDRELDRMAVLERLASVELQ